ncbi:hypothetical protein E2562_038963 [Oryza meyeriana var. granulata]|uniref:Uncharacterized protein n=1 Tax=Oryza meyeriana var. granulata TaxID=110450 RepID=A0A6G1FH51_9ORYZ|nr:hypothetical protein E2562_038963 [Oryza meyeriana var. granulata]
MRRWPSDAALRRPGPVVTGTGEAKWSSYPGAACCRNAGTPIGTKCCMQAVQQQHGVETSTP